MSVDPYWTDQTAMNYPLPKSSPMFEAYISTLPDEERIETIAKARESFSMYLLTHDEAMAVRMNMERLFPLDGTVPTGELVQASYLLGRTEAIAQARELLDGEALEKFEAAMRNTDHDFEEWKVWKHEVVQP